MAAFTQVLKSGIWRKDSENEPELSIDETPTTPSTKKSKPSPEKKKSKSSKKSD